jgi:hypothetical protein
VGTTELPAAPQASDAPSDSLAIEESLAILAHEVRSPIGAIREVAA